MTHLDVIFCRPLGHSLLFACSQRACLSFAQLSACHGKVEQQILHFRFHHHLPYESISDDFAIRNYDCFQRR